MQSERRMPGLTVTLSFLLALALFAEVLGYLSQPLNTLLGFVFLALFLGRHVSRRMVGGARRHWPARLLGIVALAGVFWGAGWVRILFVSLLVGAVRWLQSDEARSDARPSRQPSREIVVCQTTALIYGLFLWFWRETATGWYVLEGAARGLTWVTHHLGLNATLGPTAGALPVTALLFVYGAACIFAAPRPRLRPLLALFGLLLAVQLAFLAIHAGTSAALSVRLILHQGPGAAPWFPFAFLRYLYPNNLQGVAFVLGFAVTFPLTHRLLPTPEEERPVAPRRWATAGAAAVLIGATLSGLVPPRPAAKGEVLLHDAGYLNWQMPAFGSYGGNSGGMFGRLPQFLEADGYRVKMAPVTTENLRSAKALVIINLMAKFDRATKRAIWDFVRRGGSLLVLGDHTGVQGIREPSNDLLEPVHIGLNFDSAKGFRDGWLWAYGLPRHPTTLGMDTAINEIEIWIGASLSVAPPARPVIVGTYGFSDPGDMANRQNGYLGNLAYDPGEPVGEVPLVAECRYGRGKVLVFGDTSSFQNGALVYSYRFVENVFAWLTGGPSPAADALRRWAGSLFLVAGFALLVRGRRRSWPTVTAIAFLLGWMGGAGPAKALNAPSTAHNRIAWIDVSHLERVSLNTWHDDGFGGLAQNLMRNGYAPQLLTRWDARELGRGDLLVLIGPSKPFSRAEVEEIRRFVEGGKHVLLAAGREDLPGSEELWDTFGLQVGDMPLGRVLVKQPGGDVRMYKAWSIEAVRGSPKVLCSPWGYSTVVQQTVGKGSVVAIADTQFLLNRNLEGIQSYYPENIQFLRRLFGRLKAGAIPASQVDAAARMRRLGESGQHRRSPAQEGR
jgi:hypothetical protein